MRAFVGLPLSDADTDLLERQQAGLRAGRLVQPENLHVTLQFLDEQDTSTLEALHHELAGVHAPALTLTIDRLDVMGGAKPRLFCAMLREDAALSGLRDQIRQAARQVGITLPRQKFRPHITLARFPRQMETEAHQQLAEFLGRSGAFAAELETIAQFTLYQSVLAPEGPTYTPLAEYPLGA